MTSLSLRRAAKHDPCHCAILVLSSLAFLVSMCGLAAIPVGDIRFEPAAIAITANETYPTASGSYKGDKIVVEFVEGQAVREFVENEEGEVVSRSLTREWGSFTPGLRISNPGNFYQPISEWKVVPEEMPLLWVAPIWAFMTVLVTLYASVTGKRDLLLNCLVLVGVSASLLLIASHRVVELTYFCSECDAMTKHISSNGKHLGHLPDGAEELDLFADNNCPVSLHFKCMHGRNVYLAGGVFNLICMYVMFATIEWRRHWLKANGSGGLAEQDEMREMQEA